MNEHRAGISLRMTTRDISYSGREPTDLDDRQLRELTSFYRTVHDGDGLVPAETLRRCEDEMTRRFGGETTVYSAPEKSLKQPRWFERWLQ